MLGRKAVGKFHGLVQRFDEHNRAVPLYRFARTRGCRQRLQLPLDFFRDGFGQPPRRRQQDRRGVHIVLRLGQHVRRQPLRIAVSSDDQDLGGAGDKVDADLTGQKFLCRRDVDVAGPTMRSAFGTVRVPNANAAMACAPPI